jgi:alkylation response protein AidB-like acyl-CoA dehydrogenase
MPAPSLHDWLARHADNLDQSDTLAGELMPALAAHGCFRAGVPAALGGGHDGGGDVRDAILAIAAVARHSLTAALVCWGQRSFIEYLLQSPNAALRARLLPDLLDGTLAGATGLSNAMKFLSGMEPLQIAAAPAGDGWVLDGQLAWVTNVRPQRYVVAAAVAPANGAAAMVVALAGNDPGVLRSADLQLIALRGSNTAALRLEQVALSGDNVISTQASDWLPQARPAFLGMQCGMSIGLAQASLEQAALAAGPRGQLGARIAEAQLALAELVRQLLDGVADGRFVAAAPPLFRLRIALAQQVQQAVMLELQAKGGRAYLEPSQDGFARRWREAAFIPVITPSITQLEAALENAQKAARKTAQ